MLTRSVFLAFLVASGAALAQDALRLAPGARTVVRLEENPSTGYSWRLDEAGSAGLDAISIEDEGHTRGASRPGAPGTRRFAIRALRPGKATIMFEYRRPWEPAPVATRQIDVIVR